MRLCEIRYGKGNPKMKGCIPLVGSGGIYGYVNKFIVDKPTIIIGRKGTAGEIFYSEKPCYPSDTTFYLENIIEEINVKFLYYFMLGNKLSGEYAKTTLPSLQRPELEKFLIPLPPLSEQQAIANILQVIDEKIQKEEGKKRAIESLFKSMLHNLMTGELKVKRVDELKVGE